MAIVSNNPGVRESAATPDAGVGGNTSLERIGRTLVHDIATPLATMQLNLQALSTYLPKLLEVYKKQHHLVSELTPISPDHLGALARLPEAIEGDIRRLRELAQAFLADITPARPSISSEVQREEASPQSSSLPKVSFVLLVEDEEIHQQIALKQLAGKYSIDIARTGAEAIRMCDSRVYDLILLDFILPGGDGRSLVANLRQSLSKDAIVLALSNMPIKSSEYADLGIHGFLEKPFRLKNLNDALKGLVSS